MCRDSRGDRCHARAGSAHKGDLPHLSFPPPERWRILSSEVGAVGMVLGLEIDAEMSANALAAI